MLAKTTGIKIKLLGLALIVVFLSSCAPLFGPMGGFTHTAALMIGDSREDTLNHAEHILGEPKLEAYGEDKNLAVRRYTFTNVYDLVLYFYKGIFIQADLVEPQSRVYPSIREDFASVKKGSPGPKGYIITANRQQISINTLY